MKRMGFWRITLLQMSFLFAVQLIFPILAPYFSSLGYSDAWIGFVFAIFPFIGIFAGVLAADLAQKYGRSWLIRGALICTATSYALYFIGLEWSIILARFIDAAAFTTITVLLLAKAEDVISDDRRGRMTGILMSLEQSVRVIGPILGGFLADKFIGYPFFTSIGILLAMIFTLRSTTRHVKTKHFSFTPIKNIRWMWTHKQLRPYMVMGPAMHATGPLLAIILPLFITEQLGMRYVDVGFALSVYGFTHVFQFIFGDLSDRFGHLKISIIGAILYTVSLIIIGLFVHSYYGLLAMFLVLGSASAMWNVSTWSFLSEVAEKTNDENLVVGTYLSVAKIGQTVSFLLTGFIIAFFGYAGAWVVLGGVALVGSAIAMGMWSHSRATS